MTKAFFYLVFQKILARRIPHTLVGWSFVCPSGSPGIFLHREIFAHAWPSLPRLLYFAIATYSLLLWYGFWSWHTLIRCYSIHVERTVRDERVSRRRQLVQLMRAAFGYCIPPRYYYQYRLYAYPAFQWWDFIYDHELPHWHRVLSTARSTSRSLRLIVDKAYFAEFMKKLGIQTVTTLAVFERCEAPNEHFIFSQLNLFFKPRSGSRGEGCFSIAYDPVTDSYLLQSGEICVRERGDIMDYIREKITQNEYLAQPYLHNHPTIAHVLDTEILATIRMITGVDTVGCVIVSSILEIPNAARRRWSVYPIDGASGRVGKSRILWNMNETEVDRIVGLTLPHWSQAIDLCRKAHAQCRDILTIGWDVAITDNGAVLLEGNTNWGAASHQSAHGKPLLQGPLARIYLERNTFMSR